MAVKAKYLYQKSLTAFYNIITNQIKFAFSYHWLNKFESRFSTANNIPTFSLNLI